MLSCWVGWVGVCFFFFDVEVLGVFTDDDKVDRGSSRGGKGRTEDSLAGSDVGIELEGFAHCNYGGGVAFYFGGRGAATEPVSRGGLHDSRSTDDSVEVYIRT